MYRNWSLEILFFLLKNGGVDGNCTHVQSSFFKIFYKRSQLYVNVWGRKQTKSAYSLFFGNTITEGKEKEILWSRLDNMTPEILYRESRVRWRLTIKRVRERKKEQMLAQMRSLPWWWSLHLSSWEGYLRPSPQGRLAYFESTACRV